MSWKGMNGAMGYGGNDAPITMKLVDLWNELAIMDGYTYSERELPEHLRKLSDAINVVRNHLINKKL